MANIHKVKSRMARVGLSRTGLQVFVNGVEHTAHMSDEEYESESGYVRQVILSFDRAAGEQFCKGDQVCIEGEYYKLTKPQRENQVDPLFMWEVEYVGN